MTVSQTNIIVVFYTSEYTIINSTVSEKFHVPISKMCVVELECDVSYAICC